MIWHYFEVWALVAVLFAAGCFSGAYLYGLIARTRLAPAQGAVADFVGDGLDRLKARIGLGPAWRPVHLRRMERPTQLALPRPAATLQDPDPYPDPAPEPPRTPPSLAQLDYGPDEDGDVYPVAEPRPAPVEKPVAPTPEAPISSRPRRARAMPPHAVQAPAPILPEPPPAPVEPEVLAKRPAGVSAPRGGVPDNLQRIKGIGKRIEARLNSLGIFHFGQIAAWTPGEIRWIGEYLELTDRIERDAWVTQAISLAMGSDTGFEKSAERRRQRRRHQREFQARLTSAGAPEPDILPPRTLDDDIGSPAPADVDAEADDGRGIDDAADSAVAPVEDFEPRESSRSLEDDDDYLEDGYDDDDSYYPHDEPDSGDRVDDDGADKP